MDRFVTPCPQPGALAHTQTDEQTHSSKDVRGTCNALIGLRWRPAMPADDHDDAGTGCNGQWIVADLLSDCRRDGRAKPTRPCSDALVPAGANVVNAAAAAVVVVYIGAYLVQASRPHTRRVTGRHVACTPILADSPQGRFPATQRSY